MKRHSWKGYSSLALTGALTLAMASGHAAGTEEGARIYVTTTLQGFADDGQCSLQEAIYSANMNAAIAPAGNQLPLTFYATGCVAGTGDDVIELAANTTYEMTAPLDDPYNPLGPTATPIVLSPITIEGNGAQLRRANPGRDFSGLPNFRAFAVSFITTACKDLAPPLAVFRRDLSICGVDPSDELGLGNTQGSLTIRNAYIRGFTAKGGNGAVGGGGGLGAGGAIYVAGGALTVENSTFQDNGAGGGNGSRNFGRAGGGGGGLAGNGGIGNLGGGGGGGGSRGDGGTGSDDCGEPCLGIGAEGGGGGGTLDASTRPDRSAVRCGGKGGHLSLNPLDSPRDGQDGICAGGGGGGGRDSHFALAEVSGGNGGDGAYGAGGGGGAYRMTSGDGGHGGFGGGGGGAYGASSNFSGFGPSGGDGGFGGGGGAGHGGYQPVGGGGPGRGGSFAGSADAEHGGGGAALGGAIFGENAQITIRNSTFYGNYVLRGLSAGGGANSGRGAGGAIFTVDGSLSVLNSTIYRNETTTDGGGLVVYRSTRDGFSASLTLLNTILAQNTSLPGRGECYVLNSVNVVQAGGNLITNNDASQLKHEFDGSPYNDPHACPGVVSTVDPALQPLRLNAPGLTPTLAILPTSAAVDAAVIATSLPTDQRGVSRPQLNGGDIGAYEARQPSFDVAVGPFTSIALGTTATVPIVVRSLDGFMAPVSLTVDAGTSGLEVSVSPAAVNPSPEAPGLATMTVRAGADAVGGTQTIAVNASSDAHGVRTILSISVGVTPQGMIRTIDELRLRGEIATLGVATALTTKLTVAEALIDRGELQAGINTLAAFRLQVQALSGKQIGAAAAGRLLTNLELLMDDVAPELTPNPLVGAVTDAAGVPVRDAVVSILSGKTTMAIATTDATGAFYVAQTPQFSTGATYTVTVALPKGYKRATPSMLTFTWAGSQLVLQSFVLSK